MKRKRHFLTCLVLLVVAAWTVARADEAAMPGRAEDDDIAPIDSTGNPLPPELCVPKITAKGRYAAERDESDLLPFARNETPRRPHPRIRIGFGNGLCSYQTPLDGIEEAFDATENAYRAMTYTIPHPHRISIDPIQLATMSFEFNDTYAVTAQAGTSGEDAPRIGLLGGLISARMFPFKGRVAAFTAGIGAGEYHFAFEKHYHAYLGTTESDGKRYLERVNIRGGCTYFTAAGGVTFFAGRHFAFDLFAQYIGMSDKLADMPHARKVEFNLSGTMLGATITLYS